jgi:hypothetical protein
VRCLDAIDVSAIKPRVFDGKNWEAAMVELPPLCLGERQTDPRRTE